MIKGLWWYLRRSVGVRWTELLFSSELWLSAIGSILLVWATKTGRVKLQITFSGLSEALLTYASIAFGFCLTGLALALTIPDRDFAKTMAGTCRKKDGCDSYSNLMFVFSWASLVHLGLVVLSVVTRFIVNEDEKLLSAGAGCLRATLAGVFVFWSCYAIAQFFVTVVTLSQVGDVYIEVLKKKP